MSFYKYLTIVFSILIMNFAFAELRTWGMPTDTEEQESPTEATSPEEGAPEEGAPEEGAPEEGAPEEGAPEEGAPEEGAPEESTPEEEGVDMPTESSDPELSDDQPVTFKEEYVISLGFTMPFYVGTNLDTRFDKGMGLNLDFSTPFAFNLMNKNIDISGSLKMNSFTVNSYAESKGTSDYTPMLIGVNLNTDISVLDISLGTGLSIASGQEVSNSDYSMTTLFIDLGIGYSLQLGNFSFIPENLKSMNMFLGTNMVMIMGAPDESGDTSNFMNFGMSLGYPLFF